VDEERLPCHKSLLLGWGNIDLGFLLRVIEAVPTGQLAVALHPRNLVFHTRRYNWECRRLVNLAYCAGLAGADAIEIDGYWGHLDHRPFEFSDDTWGDYVAFHEPEEFVWAYPQINCPTDEECRPDCWVRCPEEVPFDQIPGPSGIEREYWRELSSYRAQPPDYGIDLSTIRCTAFGRSVHFCCDQTGPDT
jgi:hypothetical protein